MTERRTGGHTSTGTMEEAEAVKQPSKEQIKKFIKSVTELAFFKAIKGYEEDPDPDLVAVMQWLKEIADD